jgi:hypothetical protein
VAVVVLQGLVVVLVVLEAVAQAQTEVQVFQAELILAVVVAVKNLLAVETVVLELSLFLMLDHSVVQAELLLHQAETLFTPLLLAVHIQPNVCNSFPSQCVSKQRISGIYTANPY